MSIITSDLKHVWHPCTALKTTALHPPLIIHRAQGSWLETNQGRIIDGISSWWCKALGHGHPAVREAVCAQLNAFEHVITANTTYSAMAELSEKLACLSGLQRVFFASDGSSAVEISLKLALHAQQLAGKAHRNQFIALRQGYHGDTFAAMSVSDLGIFKRPYEGYGLPCHFIENIPYVQGAADPLWQDCGKLWPAIESQLNALSETACAIIVEPLIQGASGMHCYSADFLKRLHTYAKKKGIYFIADEIMTGMGRTGEWFACNHAGITPDLICLSKGLTAGFLPLSCVLIGQSIAELFYNAPPHEAFMHSHTYTGNALGVAAALAALRTMEHENINQKAYDLGVLMRGHMEYIQQKTGRLENIRGLGAVIAADIPGLDSTAFQTLALKKGALLRPIGNTLYWLPPLTIEESTISELAQITLHCIYDTP